jgi:non-ribosomal peptide synthase protein (TIGR01720 family)
VAELDEEATRALLQEVPAAYHTRINDALLTALVQAFAGWTGAPRLLLDLEGHGRDEGVFAGGEGIDLSRTMGWLTAIYPAVLELDRRGRDPGEALKSVKEQLRAVPRGGLGYGALRHLGGEAGAALRALPAPQVAFNYLGQLDRGLPESSLFAPAPESAGEPRSPRQERPWLLEIAGGVAGGRLRLTWVYSENRHDARTIQGLIDRFLGALRALIEHCRTTREGGFTPSDFPEARANQKDLDKLMARIGSRRGSGAANFR